MPRALKTCSVVGCPELAAAGRCEGHRREAEQCRGTSAQRGYSGRGHEGFRKAVLRRDPICVIDGCWFPATEADHHPLSRRELVVRGLNPNDPARGRGLCKPHHSQSTAQHQPGGWNAH
jgi:5-methylcytosine-specific restriction enzyme A